MSDISDRIQKIMDAKGINKSDLARIINVDRSYASRLTTGIREPSDRTISDICREFDVNEKWLRTGEGDMYIPKSRNRLLSEFFADVLDAKDGDPVREYCTMLASLEPEQLHQLAEISRAMMESWKAIQENKDKKEEAYP